MPESGKTKQQEGIVLSHVKFILILMFDHHRSSFPNTTALTIFQQTFRLPQQRRGFHLITSEVVQALPQIANFSTGMCQVFIQHTSASLAINENADPTVRKDFETFFNKNVPENDPDYLHNDEGSDDMPAHLKAALLGSSVSVPIRNGRLALGIWQGIYLCEHRDRGGSRSIVVTAWGE